ncbi:MAG: ATP-binding protein [Acidobacteria bacterium]|nr:ATP-binding protein [Acidobacteriota bacterium]
MRNRVRYGWFSYFLPLIGVAGVTVCYKLLVTGVNATTVALSFLLVVLTTAAAQGIGPSILASIAGMVCFNFFFLPPVGTFTIHDPQNWVALFAFLLTAIIASHLSSAARGRTREAEQSREEVWKLYQLSRAIIITPDPETAVSTISRQVREVFDIHYCDIFTPGTSGGLERLEAISSSLETAVSDELLGEVFEKGALKFDAAQGSTYAPLKIGVRVTGVLFLSSGPMEKATIEAISGLVALALERARFLKELSRTEALRQSDQLKSALLASVSHDLRTPLTSMRAAVDNLLESSLDWDREALHEFHLIISEEVSRLTRLVQNLLEMARIEAGELRPVREWGSVPEIFSNVLERCAAEVSNHRVQIECAENLPMIKVDFRLLASVLANLVENAAHYSPARSEIVLRGEVDSSTLKITVHDHGPGIPADELPRVFDKFYRGSSRSVNRREGTGMGLAIARGIVEAHGGKIWAESTPRSGTIFSFSLPVEIKAAAKLAPVGDEG